MTRRTHYISPTVPRMIGMSTSLANAVPTLTFAIHRQIYENGFCHSFIHQLHSPPVEPTPRHENSFKILNNLQFYSLRANENDFCIALRRTVPPSCIMELSNVAGPSFFFQTSHEIWVGDLTGLQCTVRGALIHIIRCPLTPR